MAVAPSGEYQSSLYLSLYAHLLNTRTKHNVVWKDLMGTTEGTKHGTVDHNNINKQWNQFIDYLLLQRRYILFYRWKTDTDKQVPTYNIIRIYIPLYLNIQGASYVMGAAWAEAIEAKMVYPLQNYLNFDSE